jgi:hypothetical protein
MIMTRRFVARAEAPVMVKGTLLSLKSQKKGRVVPVDVTLSFKAGTTTQIASDSAVISAGEFTTQGGKTYLRCISPVGFCWIRLKELEKHRPGCESETGKIIDRPKRLSSQ